jgi:hypothetical protein
MPAYLSFSSEVSPATVARLKAQLVFPFGDQ